MGEIFYQYRIEIIFIHIVSAVVWVGGMISAKFAAHPSIMQITGPQERMERLSLLLKRLFLLVIVFVLLLAMTGAFLTVAYDIKHTEYHYISLSKDAIWAVMFFNLLFMMKKRKMVDEAMQKGDFNTARATLELIGRFLVPINITLGLVEIGLGVFLRVSL